MVSSAPHTLERVQSKYLFHKPDISFFFKTLNILTREVNSFAVVSFTEETTNRFITTSMAGVRVAASLTVVEWSYVTACVAVYPRIRGANRLII